MRHYTNHEIASILDAQTKGNATILGVSLDNRKVKDGDLFVCLRGEKVDGHTFAQSAIDQGAVCLLVDRFLEIDCPQILVPNTLKGMVEFARQYRMSLPATFIAISGSNGKTSTKDMLNRVLSNVGPTVATLENQNTEIGACLNLFRMDDSTQFGVFEMGLDDPGDLAKMTYIIQADYAILTSLDQAHMDNYGSLENLGQEKFTLFDGMEPSRCYYNGDSPIYRALAQGQHSFGFNDDNEYWVSNVLVAQASVSFTVNSKPYSVNLLGRHQACNAGGVVAVLWAMGIKEAAIQDGLKDVTLTKMRTELFTLRQATILFDAYKSSPQSAKAALDVAASVPFTGPRVCVMADMFMLGDGSLERHREVLSHGLSLDFSTFYLYGPEFGAIVSEFKDPRITWFESFDVLHASVQNIYDTQSLILFKGSRTYELERLLKEGTHHA